MRKLWTSEKYLAPIVLPTPRPISGEAGCPLEAKPIRYPLTDPTCMISSEGAEKRLVHGNVAGRDRAEDGPPAGGRAFKDFAQRWQNSSEPTRGMVSPPVQ
jgi:hypothetical protein